MINYMNRKKPLTLAKFKNLNFMKMMKHLMLFAAMLLSTAAFAQSKQNPNSIRVAGGVHDSFGPYDQDNFPYGVWNTDNLDEAFQLQYARYFNEFIDFGINVTAADVDNMYDDDFSPTNDLLDAGSSVDLDLIARYKFYNGEDFNESALIRPYLYTGLSGTYVSELERVRNVEHGFGGNVPLGIGFKIAAGERVHLDLSGAFRIGLFNKVPNRWEHMAGLSFNFGPPIVDEIEEEPVVPMPEPKDSDNDGIIDAEDDCPYEAGVPELDGCPEPVDTDGDGVIDEEDNCPDVAGTVNGCPDTDGDGIIDRNDDCPDVAGVASMNGCPEPVDTDGDGVADEDDRCPETAGLAELGGCPDSDGDGFADIDDQCPDVPGVAAQQGCPEEVEQEVIEQMEDISENIFFELDSFDLKAESRAKLDEVLSILERYQNFNLSIEGHTDSTGAASYNQTLSEKRAAAVRDYLVSRGVPANRVSSVGYGENQPIADNSTAAGRAQNRRVELLLRMMTTTVVTE